MVFRLVCGDVMPGCAARFEEAGHDLLLQRVAEHAAADHDLTEITPEIQQTIERHVVVVRPES